MLQKAQEYLKSNPNYIEERKKNFSFDQKIMRTLIGLAAIGLPIILFLGYIIGNLAGHPVCFHISVSHFYYAPVLGTIFVMILAFTGTFMIAFQGESPGEKKFTNISGSLALGVALFPTKGDGCAEETFLARPIGKLTQSGTEGASTYKLNNDTQAIFEVFNHANTIHYVCAFFLFLSLAVYIYVYLMDVNKNIHYVDGIRTFNKACRNWIYMTCIIVILVSMLSLGLLATTEWLKFLEPINPFFIFEATALMAFGTAWLVKGRVFGTRLLDPDEKMEKLARLDQKNSV